ncbi:hypothetical protein G7Z17_g7580 [Cylindrodendrum hubeiense]|uniref:FAD-binding PCMH-type domain-containing protein n=1 Tax=Cylindrodendrum hubeiense TaxID=595255 RepID=A0A9P5LF68_9HYPO|nr:hypothetical protein G7Z17_g7580 [Cylindrodendrum hubeiense]
MASKRVLPRGVTEATLHNFFEHVEGILGKANVSRDNTTGALEGLNGDHAYIDPFATGHVRTANGAVRPNSPQQVSAVLKAANQFRIPLWTLSRGKNLGYCGSSPLVDGSIILDLHRMSKIIELSEKYAYAILEPGVSFLELYDAIQERGLKLWMSAPGIGWGSCGLEVVTPTGEIIRSGMGAMSDSKLWPLHKGGFGPSIDGLFFQSNLGVVTKIGVHLCPAPEAFTTCEVSVYKREDLGPLTVILSDLYRQRIIGNAPSITDIYRQCLRSEDPKVLKRVLPFVLQARALPKKLKEEIRVEQGWGHWLAFFALFGTTEVVPAQLASVNRAISTIPGAKITFNSWPGVAGEALKASVMPEHEIPQSGVPTMKTLRRFFGDGSGRGHVTFSPILPPGAKELNSYYLEAETILDEEDANNFGDIHITERFVYAISLINFLPGQAHKVRQTFRKLFDLAAKHGYTEYRTHLDFMDDVAAQLDFNGHALRKYTTLIKDATDPHGILSPGKSGIWPSNSDF